MFFFPPSRERKKKQREELFLSLSLFSLPPSAQRREHKRTRKKKKRKELKNLSPAFAEMDLTADSSAASDASPLPSELPPRAALHFFLSRA